MVTKKSILAGIFIGLAGIGTLYCPEYKPIIFPAGLLMVVLTSSDLFTGKMLYINSVVNKEAKMFDLSKYWLKVYVGNFIGSLLISLWGARLLHTDVYTPTPMTTLELFMRSVLCNVLVCLAVYLCGQTNRIAEKAIVVYACISLFVLCGYQHSIANMTYYTIGIVQGTMTIAESVCKLFIVTIGNIIGGIIIALMLRE